MTIRHQRGAALIGAALLGLAACASHAPTPRRAPARAAATSSATSTVTVAIPKGTGATPFDRPRKLSVPKGWHVSVWSRVADARLEAWTPDRKLLVSRPDKGDIVALIPRLHRTPAQHALVSGLNEPHGMAFHGNTLWVAERNEIDTFSYTRGRVGKRHVVIRNLPGGNGSWSHPLKSVVVNAKGVAYFSVGSSANIAPGDRTATPQAAVIMRYDPATKKQSVFARGVRNGTGLALDPAGYLWTAMNNRDQMPYPYHKDYDRDGSDDYGKIIPGYVADHPIEPVAKLLAGRDLGWPYCDPDPDVRPGVRGTALTYKNRPFVDDPNTNPTGSHLNCAKLKPVEQGLPAHSAPLGMSFATLPKPLGTGALIAVHGSWDRTPPRAPSVVFLPWSARGLGSARPLVTGFQNKDGSRWGRTVAAVRGPDGAIYISDDQAGAIYRLTATR